MAKRYVTKAVGDYVRSFAHESGVDYRHQSQELQPAMDRVAQIRHAQELITPGNNPNGRQFIGSVPAVVLTDWLKRNGYTHEEFGRNEGGRRCPPGEDPVAHCQLDGGVRSKFLRYFLTRDFSKLHTQHSTTRVGTGNRIVVPNNIGGADGDNKLPGVKAADS